MTIINSTAQSQRLKALPHSDVAPWRERCAQDYVWVDKTAHLTDLLRYQRVCLNGLCGMGNTTLIAMLEELFTHGDKSFAGMAVYGKWPKNERYPVIRLEGKKIVGSDPTSLVRALEQALVQAYDNAGLLHSAALALEPDQGNFLRKFGDLCQDQRLVFLIDDWNYPLNQYLGQAERYHELRAPLITFYQWILALPNLRFLLLTGGLGYGESTPEGAPKIHNLSLRHGGGKWLGVTSDELHTYYFPYLESIAQRLGYNVAQLLELMEQHYLSGCWDSDTKVMVYSFSDLNQFLADMMTAPEENRLKGEYYWWLHPLYPPGSLRLLLEMRPVDLPQLLFLLEHDVTLTQEDMQETSDYEQLSFLGMLYNEGYLTIRGEEQLYGEEDTEDDDELYKCWFPDYITAQDAHDVIMEYIQEQIGMDQAAFAPRQQALVAALEQGDLAQVCVQLNELMAGVNFAAFERIDREFYRRLLFLWLKEKMAQIEIYTPEDQWLCALRLITRGGRHYQLEIYCMETLEPYRGDKAEHIAYGRLESGIKLYPAQTAEVERYRGKHGSNKTSEFSRVGLLFDQSHHVIAWSKLDHDGDFYQLVEKFNPFAKYTNQTSTTAS